MKINKIEKENYYIYKFEGRMDFHPHDLLEGSVLNDALESHIKAVLLDFSELKYISSLGIRYIYDIKALLMEKNIPLSIIGCSPAIKQVFSLLGLLETFSIFSSEKEAVEFLEIRP